MPKEMPVYYIPHGGGPCFFMPWNPPDTWTSLETWLRGLRHDLPEEPRALLVMSAHWEEPEFTLGAKTHPGLYYDYYGFPEDTYRLSWPVEGAPELAARCAALLDAAGIPYAADTERDLDHGVFVPMLLSFPHPSWPVMQLSLRRGLNAAEHIALGAALAPLRKEGVLVVGSGMSFHNMRAFRHGDNQPIAGAEEFAAWLDKAACADPAERAALLADWERAPNARFSHPREEHLLPLMICAGAAGNDAGRIAWSGRAMGAPLAAYRFG